MNIKLIFTLSGFGLAMAFGTTYLIGSRLETICWLPIFVTSAYFVGRYARKQYFLHGFLLSLLNYTWIALVHINLFDRYLAQDTRTADLYHKILSDGITITQAVILTSASFGVISGIFLGLFASIAAKFFPKS